jgi:hypothetical protein
MPYRTSRFPVLQKDRRANQAGSGFSAKSQPGTALIPVDDVVDNLPFIVRRDHRIVAAFARKQAAIDWAELRSFNDERRFTVHTAMEVIDAYQDGESVK